MYFYYIPILHFLNRSWNCILVCLIWFDFIFLCILSLEGRIDSKWLRLPEMYTSKKIKVFFFLPYYVSLLLLLLLIIIIIVIIIFKSSVWPVLQRELFKTSNFVGIAITHLTFYSSTCRNALANRECRSFQSFEMNPPPLPPLFLSPANISTPLRHKDTVLQSIPR